MAPGEECRNLRCADSQFEKFTTYNLKMGRQDTSAL